MIFAPFFMVSFAQANRTTDISAYRKNQHMKAVADIAKGSITGFAIIFALIGPDARG